jgi:NAD(P)-dependent dehydrogenase (short-subunit alcohol dehydrogenase family)
LDEEIGAIWSSSMDGYQFDLTDRVILVTGASSGIGAHLARSLSASGAKVVLAARRAELLGELRDEILAAGGQAAAVAMDVSDETSVIAAYDAAEAAFGPVDSVIANAGLAIGGSALGLDAEDFDRMVAVNLRGVFLTAREGARRMIAADAPARGHGRIVLVSSITAQHVSGGMVTYSATKAAVVQMGRTMAFDWAAKGVNVNVICPGYMRTDINSAYLDSPKGQAMLAQFPRHREMPVTALDPMILYLCSDASGPVTGSVFTIDDGQSL